MALAQTQGKAATTQAKPAAFNPTGKTFDQRLNAFLQDVKTTYALTISKDNGRTVAWQQKHHVAHMFLYNAYKSTKPAKVETGKRTISWDHFSNAQLKGSEPLFTIFSFIIVSYPN